MPERGLRAVTLKIQLPPRLSSLHGRKLLFFSDIHLRPTGKAPAGKNLPPWHNAGFPGDAILRVAEEFQPDYTLFGGDLIRHICCFDAGISFLKAMPGRRKLSVYGNWDKRRASWFPFQVFERELESASFVPLVNEAVTIDGIRFFGLDDFKSGFPRYEAPEKKPLFNCVLSHNPDAVPLAMTEQDLRGTDLILCGHTHGGQIRIPGYGAVLTSSIHGKRFEYGLYENKDTGTEMFVSAGLGITFIPVRIFCPPEIVKIELTAQQGFHARQLRRGTHGSREFCQR